MMLVVLGSELIERAQAAGVTKVLATGVSLHGSQQVLAFAQAHASVSFTAGVHPRSAKEWNSDTSQHLAGIWSNPKVVAVGECGLDYCRMFSPKVAQRAAFQAQIAAAVSLDKPLFLHCRDAFEDFYAMLADAATAGARGVVHCFTGDAREAQAYLALGFDLGITGEEGRERTAGIARFMAVWPNTSKPSCARAESHSRSILRPRGFKNTLTLIPVGAQNSASWYFSGLTVFAASLRLLVCLAPFAGVSPTFPALLSFAKGERARCGLPPGSACPLQSAYTRVFEQKWAAFTSTRG